jgi:NADP-dependent 3-hydroxy acid dehydrogenase YdfG
MMNTRSADLPARALLNHVAVVTGASSGIGKAIAIALAREGATICGIGRDTASLDNTIKEARLYSNALPYYADLAVDENIEGLTRWLTTQFDRVDILVHSAGLVRQSRIRDARMADLDLLYAVNLRAPYMLTQQLLPMLKSSRGQIVFINSSVGLTAARAEIGQYAATKHALKAMADSLRDEVNPEGIRVLTVYPGRTATPGQKSIHQDEQKDYRPELLLQPEDVASVVVHSLTLPLTAEVTDISIRPMIKT